MIPVFVLSYVCIDYFDTWFSPDSYGDAKIYIVDNGIQEIPDRMLDFLEYQTRINVGCAGGWNLCASIAFEHYGYDKILIGQDDAIFTKEMLQHVYNETTPDMLAGAYDRSFEFSLFGLHREMYEDVGMFDENFIFAGCEDGDYKKRIELSGRQWRCLNYNADLNQSMSSKRMGTKLNDSNRYNVIYSDLKWGKGYEYEHPFDNEIWTYRDVPIQSGLTDTYGRTTRFPSIGEYENFITEGI